MRDYRDAIALSALGVALLVFTTGLAQLIGLVVLVAVVLTLIWRAYR